MGQLISHVKRYPQRAAGVTFTILSVSVLILLAAIGSQPEPPSGAWQAFLAAVGFLFQLGAAWAFSTDGKAHRSLAVRAVRHLVKSATDAHETKLLVETAFEAPPSKSEARDVLGPISVRLSYQEDAFLQAVEDWDTFHPRVVEEIRNSGTLDGDGNEH